MLVRFRVANHRSIRDEQVLNFTRAPRSTTPAFSARFGIDVLRVAGIYGANASGKSNVLNALGFMSDAVARSHTSWPASGPIKRAPFRLDTYTRQQPSEYELDFLVDDVLYTYGFRLNNERILSEWLWSYPNGRKVHLFSRNEDGALRFGKSLRGPNRAIQKLTRPNSLFLSAAAQNNHPQLDPIYAWLTNKIRHPSNILPISGDLLHDIQYRHRTLNMLRAADLGITDLSIHERQLTKSDNIMFDALRTFAETVGDDQSLELPDSIQTVKLHHSTAAHPKGIAIPFEAESVGTKVLFGLAPLIFETLDEGGILCIDEFDSSLHPLIMGSIVRLFQHEDSNPNNGQLVFNANDTSLLYPVSEQESLFRDQIWFTEKDADGATRLYPLSDFHPRKQENIRRGYLQGRYGAVPIIDLSQLLHPVERRERRGSSPQLQLGREPSDT